MNTKIKNIIESLNTGNTDNIAEDRKIVLTSLSASIQQLIDKKQEVRLNFICTHNSRRSHLSQVWAQTLANYYTIPKVFSYSGGSEATAMYPMAVITLQNQGFEINQLVEVKNPVYSIKYDTNSHPIIGFSKTFDDSFNPQSNFIAVMTCSNADENCPFIAGATERIALTFDDPKAFDNTPQQAEKYEERSLQIATELNYVFKQLKNSLLADHTILD